MILALEAVDDHGPLMIPIQLAAVRDYKHVRWLTKMGRVSLVGVAPVPFYVLHRLGSGPRAETLVNVAGMFVAVPSMIPLLLGGLRRSFPALSPQEEQRCRELFDNQFFTSGERPCPRCGEAVTDLWGSSTGWTYYFRKRCGVCGARVV
jgi:hypothetical protein